jgi:hypothetical protein
MQQGEASGSPSARNSESACEAVLCTACTGLDFINRLNGKLPGQD